jgi:hypothetical protein
MNKTRSTRSPSSLSRCNMDEKKKPKVEAAPLLRNLKMANPNDKDDQKTLPSIVSLLVPIWRDGTLTRQPGRMTIVPDGSAWRVTIECPTEGVQCSFTVDNLRNLMQDSEKFVTQPGCHWGLTWARKKKSQPTIETAIE